MAIIVRSQWTLTKIYDNRFKPVKDEGPILLSDAAYILDLAEFRNDYVEWRRINRIFYHAHNKYEAREKLFNLPIHIFIPLSFWFKDFHSSFQRIMPRN